MVTTAKINKSIMNVDVIDPEWTFIEYKELQKELYMYVN